MHRFTYIFGEHFPLFYLFYCKCAISVNVILPEKNAIASHFLIHFNLMYIDFHIGTREVRVCKDLCTLEVWEIVIYLVVLYSLRYLLSQVAQMTLPHTHRVVGLDILAGQENHDLPGIPLNLGIQGSQNLLKSKVLR